MILTRTRTPAPPGQFRLGASAPNCIYLQRTEQRYGDGDGIFTVSEQTRAVDALYNHIRGEQNFTVPSAAFVLAWN